MIEMSTALRALLLQGTGLQEAMQGGVIRLYPGQRPSSPDAGVSHLHAAEITVGGDPWLPAPANSAGITVVYDAAMDGLVSNDELIVSGTRTETVTWFRYYGPDNDVGNASTTFPRIDGDCGVDLILDSYNVSSSYERTLEAFVVSFL